MKILRLISRILVGLVFVFSGFVKGVDPLGSNYKFLDYFDALGIGFLQPLSLFFGILLCTAEFIIGISLLLNYRMKITAWALLIFMSFFLILTLYVAIANPVKDCGCFGDAIVISNWATFWKNVVFMLFTLIIFFQRDKYVTSNKPLTEWLVLGFFVLIFVLFNLYNYKYLPILDFRPFKPGTFIPDAMSIPADAEKDVYQTIFYYKNKKTGEIKKFDESNYPWQDTINWEFESYDNKLVKKGYEPPIHGFNISNKAGDIVTDSIIRSNRYTFLLISYNVLKASQADLIKADYIAQYCSKDDNFAFYAITASPEGHVRRIKKRVSLSYNFYFADDIVLKTMIRSNPGLILIKDGVVLDMWPNNCFPAVSTLNKHFISEVITRYRKENNALKIYLSVSIILLLFSLIPLVKNIFCKK